MTGYEVFRADARVASVGEAFAQEERLTPGKEYCWTVTAVDAAGNRSAASDPACPTIPDTTPPTVPARVTASASGERSVDLAWEASQDDVGRGPLRDPAGWCTRSRLDGTATRDRGLAPGRRHCFAVRACDAAGNCSSPSPEACATTPDLTPPTRPATFDAVARSDVAIELAWAASTDEVGVVGYEVKRDDKVLAASHPGLAFKEGGLRPGTRYCYSVLALDAAGNRSGRRAPASPPSTSRRPPGRAGPRRCPSPRPSSSWAGTRPPTTSGSPGTRSFATVPSSPPWR